MKKLIRVIKISLTAGLVLAIVILCLVAANSFSGTLFDDIASHVPVLKNFVVKTFPTYLYGKTCEDTSVLKIARYDIDYLASFTGKDGRYVALYPFTVEAEIPLDRIERDAESGALIVPHPEYVSHIDQEAAASMVFMDTLELDYNRMVAPVLAMYHEKSIDLAMEDRAFADDCKKKAEAYITDLLGENKIVWANLKDDSTASHYLPVTFHHEGDNGRTVFMEGSSIRDAFTIRTTRFDAPDYAEFRFGRSFRMLGSFDDFAARACRTNPLSPKSHIVFRYHDPMHGGDMTFASLADEGYRSAFVYLRGGTDVYYVEAAAKRDINGEAFARNVAPNVLYLASSARPSASVPDRAARYDAYWRAYETALGEVKAKRYGRQLSLALEELDRVSRETGGGDSGDAAVIRKIVNLKNGGEDLLASLLASDSSQSEMKFGDDAELDGNIEALFWTMRGEIGLTDQGAEEYKRDLLSRGTAISRDFVASLGSEERNTLYANFFVHHLPADKKRSVYVDENGKAETWLYFGAAANEWKEKTTQKKVAEKLEANGMERGNHFIFVYSEPEGTTGFFTHYHALVLDGETVTLYPNFARWLTFLGKGESAPFTGVTFIDGSFSVGKRTVSEHPEIAGILKMFAEAFSSDGYSRDRVLELMSGNLEKEAIATLERPTLE